MNGVKDKTVLVTGAASGIGKATALAFADAGARLVLCDIDAEALDTTAGEAASRSACLLSKRLDVSNADDMGAFAEAVHAEVPAVDILVNNAGVYLSGGLLDVSLEDLEWVLSVNLWGVINTTHFFVPRMVDHKVRGHVANVSSMFGFWASPQVIGYLTSKFAVFGFSEALREDLRPHGIAVSTVCPGIVRTGLVERMRIRNGGNGEEIRGNLARIYQRRNFAPEKVARAIVKAAAGNRSRVIPVSAESHLMYRLGRHIPYLNRLIARNAARRMFQP